MRSAIAAPIRLSRSVCTRPVSRLTPAHSDLGLRRAGDDRAVRVAHHDVAQAQRRASDLVALQHRAADLDAMTAAEPFLDRRGEPRRHDIDRDRPGRELHHTMPQLATAANATTPVPISTPARPAASACASDVRAIMMVFGTQAAGGAFGQRAAMQTQGRPDLTQRRAAELIPEPVMRSRTSPRFRGPSPRIQGRRRPDRCRSRSRTNLPRSASPLPASHPSSH